MYKRQIQINFGSQSATFTYDAEKMQYLKQINGNPQIDAVTGEQLGFTNVFVLETEISIRDDVGPVSYTHLPADLVEKHSVYKRNPEEFSLEYYQNLFKKIEEQGNAEEI